MMNSNKIKQKELLRFLVGGTTAVLVDYLVYHLLLILGVDRELAKGSSFICGALVGFLINKYWTFEKKSFDFREIIKYVILYACTAVINAFVNKTVIDWFGMELLGFLAATGVSTVLNFLGQKFFVFR